MPKPKSKTPSLPSGPDAWSGVPILFCGHAGYFYGDVIVTPFAVTVLATANFVGPGALVRKQLEKAQWHISDQLGGYWNPTKGRFVLPRASVTRLTPENIEEFIRAT